MAADYVIGYDAIRVNIPHLPAGARAYAGYSTGSGDVPWTEPDFAARATSLGPCLRIDQDPAASVPTADILDVERGAATVQDCAWWVKRAQAHFSAGTRPGQRRPAIYMSASVVPGVVNALISGGVTSGAGLLVANWSLTRAQAVADVLAASGPFPVIGVQWSDAGLYDVDVFSLAWLAGQSGKPAPVPPPVPVPPSVPVWQEALMNTLPTLAEGAADQAGHVFFVHRMQALIRVAGQARDIPGAGDLTADGQFGPVTTDALKAVQAGYQLTPDGVCGPRSWSVLITGAP